MNWRGALVNRFVIVPLIVIVVAAVWNVYISFHDDGIVAGEVRDAAGAPVAGAIVILYDRNFVTYRESQRTRSDPAGQFRFENNNTHLGQIEAQAADGRQSERRPIRLWFRAQNVRLDAPLVVRAQGS